jgi:biuret amidohydrolase
MGSAVPPELAELLHPTSTAVVTSECQNGVVGRAAVFPELAAAAGPAVDAIGRLAAGARDAGVQVVHCVALRRADGRGASGNARLFAAAARSPVPLTPGSEAASLLPGLADPERDLVLSRLHGLSPMAGTDLDPILRNLGVRTVVVAGVSVNVAVTNLVMDAVNAGYQVVVPSDAVAGVPADYAAAVIDHTLSLLATVVEVRDVLAAWRGGS